MAGLAWWRSSSLFVVSNVHGYQTGLKVLGGNGVRSFFFFLLPFAYVILVANLAIHYAN